jgi:hypothetical protein
LHGLLVDSGDSSINVTLSSVFDSKLDFAHLFSFLYV